MRLNSYKTINFSFLAIFLILLTIISTATQANAATFTVTRTDDRNTLCDSGVDCSLREAISATNAAATDDVIIFDAVAFATAQTITLSGTQLTIENNGGLTINGTGTSLLIISGNNQSRVFLNKNINVTFNDLTISNGSTGIGHGGGILWETGGLMIINNSNISNNSAGSNTNGQTFGGTGGGIYAISGSIIINNSSISNNFAGTEAGGVYSGLASLTITNSTINANTASGRCGGISISKGLFTKGSSLTNSSVTNNKSIHSDGGGIVNTGTLNVNNSTISNNLAGNTGGGIYSFNNAVVTFANSTISGNKAGFGGASGDGGGINNSSSSITLRNTILADNSRGVGAGIPDDFRGSLISQGYNLIETAIASQIVGDSTGNILGQDPLLQPLAFYGGITQTQALTNGSPAINAGNNENAPPTDQRGYARIIGGTIDIGAFEFAPVKSRKRVRFF